jgi:putative copper resistance protein D
MVMAWLLLGTLTALPTTAYGQTLLVKLLLVAMVLGLAAANKLRFIPAMQRGDKRAARHLVRAINIETAVMFLVLAATATLTSVLTLPT